MDLPESLSIVILISGNGSNLQAIIDAITTSELTIKIDAVISSNENAFGLERAKSSKIPNHVISPKAFKNRSLYDDALLECIAQYSPDLIVLAGFMRILGPNFLNKFENKIINIHPSLLPLYPGLNSHQLALAEGATHHGCSIHFVNEHLDAGPIIAQASVSVCQNDTVESLEEKVHTAEHFLYPLVLHWFAQKRIELIRDQVFLDKIPLPSTGLPFLLKHANKGSTNSL